MFAMFFHPYQILIMYYAIPEPDPAQCNTDGTWSGLNVQCDPYCTVPQPANGIAQVNVC